MSLRISQWVGLIGVAATIPLVQTVATAKSSVEIGDIATSITVLITNSSGGNGSGVILQHQGNVYTVLTVAHVMKNKARYQITTPDGRQHNVIDSSIVAAPGDIDLAVIKFRSTTNYPTAKLGNCNMIKLGMDIYVAGFSGTTLGRTTPVLDFKEGKVSSNSYQTQAHGYSLIYDNNTMPGMSGGTVLNNNGELIAIHGVGDKDRDGLRTGSNMAIPVNRFATVASRMGVELNGKVAAIPKNTTRTAEDHFASGRGKLQFSDASGALSEFNRAIEINPRYTSAYVSRGNLKTDELNDTQGALADYNKAIQLNPNHAIAYHNRGLLKHEKLNDIQGALADYNRAIQLNPNYADAYSNHGRLKHEKLNDIQGALADYNRAIQLNPNHAIAYHNRGLLKMNKLNEIQGALADYNRAIQLNPNYADAYNNRGILKMNKLNEIQGALADYNRAIQLNPNHGDAYNNRGVLKMNKLKDRAGAINDMKRAISLYQQQGDRKRYQRAIDLLKKWQ